MMDPRTSSDFPSMYYSKTGTGPVIVLLHGFPESGTLWQNISGELAMGATLIIPDLPGAGRSPLEKGTSIDEMADGIKTILDKENIDRVVLAGHSMGGYVALAFADKYPGNVSGLSLVHSAPGADDEEKKATRQKAIDLIRKGGKSVFTSQMVPNLFSDTFKEQHPEVIKERTEQAMKMDGDSMINFYNAMMQRKDRTQVITDAPFPIQWIMGKDDKIIPYNKILPHCYRSAVNFVCIYNDCGHMSMIETPQRLARDLQHFNKYCDTYHQERI